MSNSSVESIRAKTKSKTWTVEKIAAQLDELPRLDHEFLGHCRSIQDELIPALLQAMHNQASPGRLNASLLLLRLGHPDGTDGIISCLRDSDETLRQKCLLNLSLLPPEPFPFARSLPFEPPQPLPLKKEPLFAELKPFLTQSNVYHIQLALRAITNINPSNAQSHIQPLLKHPSRAVKLQALHWYACRSESAEALPVAQQLLFSTDVQPTDNGGVIGSLEIYCKGENKALAEQVAALLARFILTYLDYPGNEMANLISNAMSGLKAAGYSRERQVIEAVFTSKVEDWRRGAALRRLAEIDGKAGIELLKASLSDRILRPFAAQGIAKVHGGSTDAGVADALLQALEEEKQENVISDLISALIAVEGRAAACLLDTPERLPPYDAMRLHWLSENIDPQSASNLLVKANIIEPPAKERLRQLRREWEENHQAASVVFNLLDSTERLLWFDAEAAIVPVEYVGLLQEFVELGRGIFDADSFLQEVDEGSGESEIQFVLGNRLHAFRCRDHGDWYDVEAVINGVNEAVAKLGKHERFILLYTGDQSCAVTFAPDRAFRQVARKLRLPIEDDFQAAMNAGIAYEQYVRRQLSEK